MTEPGERRSGNGSEATAGQGTTAEAPPAAGAKQAGQPLFYKEPQPLHETMHAGKGLRQPRDFCFAARAHAVAVHIQEFRLAMAHYPIVFTDDETAMPLAILGYREGQNLFVGEDGQWAADTYVPAYVRRYPFATGQGAKPDEAILYVDAASDLLVDLATHPEADALFTDTAPSAHTKQALDFCAAFQRQAPVTQAFVRAVAAHELLESKEIRLDLPGGGKQLLTGLRIVDEAKFNALPDDVFLEWRRQGWVALVYWHWASMDNFRRMVLRG